MIIAIVNIKGGVSKTTSAIAIACAAHTAGYTARVLDADPQGSASEWSLVAQDAGTPLPFDVTSANVASVSRLKRTDVVTIIDCPPTGAVTDAAVDVADFVLVPTTPAPIDLAKTHETVAVLESRGIAHGVLLTRVMTRTLSYQHAVGELEDVSAFDTVIPKREAIVGTFGKPFTTELFGYEQVFDEIVEALSE